MSTALMDRPTQTDAALVAEVLELRARLLDGERKLTPLLGTADARLQAGLARWHRLEGAYRWAVSELRERGLEEPCP